MFVSFGSGSFVSDCGRFFRIMFVMFVPVGLGSLLERNGFVWVGLSSYCLMSEPFRTVLFGMGSVCIRIVRIAFGWRSFQSDCVRFMFGYIWSDYKPNFENSLIHSYPFGYIRITFVLRSDRSEGIRIGFGSGSVHTPY